MGPSAIRYAGVVDRLEAIGHEVADEGNIQIEIAKNSGEQNSKLKNLNEVITANQKLAVQVEETVRKGGFPLVLGGDHSIAIGTLAGLSTTYKNLGVIWYDAHADLNTSETSPSGNIHGMPMAVSIGLGDEQLVNIHKNGPKVQPENIVIIGARAVDPGERLLIKEKGIKVYTMHEIDKYGMTAVIQDSIAYLQSLELDRKAPAFRAPHPL